MSDFPQDVKSTFITLPPFTLDRSKSNLGSWTVVLVLGVAGKHLCAESLQFLLLFLLMIFEQPNYEICSLLIIALSFRPTILHHSTSNLQSKPLPIVPDSTERVHLSTFPIYMTNTSVYKVGKGVFFNLYLINLKTSLCLLQYILLVWPLIKLKSYLIKSASRIKEALDTYFQSLRRGVLH